MRTVGIKVLKDKLSEYIRAAAAGETIQVTDRDTVVAEITAPLKGRAANADHEGWEARRDELIRRGVLTPATGRGGPLPRPKPVMTFEEMMRDLDESREDRA